MYALGLIDIKNAQEQPLYQYKVDFQNDNGTKIFVIKNHLIFFGDETLSDGTYLADQIELPLDSLDWILSVIARFDLPPNVGGYKAGTTGDRRKFGEEDDIVVGHFIHPKYGLETFDIESINRMSYIAQLPPQTHTIFKTTLDEGLLAFLIDVNKRYKNGEFS